MAPRAHDAASPVASAGALLMSKALLAARDETALLPVEDEDLPRSLSPASPLDSRRRLDSPPTRPGAAQSTSFPGVLAKFEGHLLLLGFGSIGAGVLPLLLRHLRLDPQRCTVLTAPDRERQAREAHSRYGLGCIVKALTEENYLQVLEPLLGPGDYLLNLSVDVSSVALLRFCASRGVLYQDTVVEPWAGGYFDGKRTVSDRSNYAQREEMLELKRALGPDGPTALVTHGANPGLVSHFVKQALLNIAKDTDTEADAPEPASRAEWAALASRLGIKAIHISERDSQAARAPKRPGEFVNTWSVDGFISEGCQPAELGWGTHEHALPADGAQHAFGSGAAIYLNRPGCQTKVRTWTPAEGPFHGFLITHNEAISIADFLTVRGEDGQPTYRPTVHYAYHPCDAAVASLHELAGKNYQPQANKRLIVDEVEEGMDELGVLLCGNPRGAYWYGSQLSIARARSAVESNSATSLQVAATVLGGMVWTLEHPRRGIVEPEEVQEWRRILEIAEPYVAPVVGQYTEWNPLQGRGTLFPEDLDQSDPWQFSNVRVQ